MPSDGAMTSGRAASAAYPLILYGWADFRAIRLEGRLYVDKTRFLRPLEDERFVFLIRPRRFGKSCWLSFLENYYDRKWASESSSRCSAARTSAANPPRTATAS